MSEKPYTPIMVGVGPVNVDAKTAGRWVGRGILFVVGVLVIVLILASVAVAQGNKVEVACGPVAEAPLGDKGLDATAKLGEKMSKPDFSSPWQIVKTVFGMLNMVKLWMKNLETNARGLPDDPAVTGWRNRTEQNTAAALAACCPVAPENANPDPPVQDEGGDGTPPPSPPAQQEPWDPKWASVSYRGGQTKAQKEARQVAILAEAVKVRKQLGLPERADLVIGVTGLVESQIENITHGDRDSVGWLQQRRNWGTFAERTNVATSARLFFEGGSKAGDGWSEPGLTDIDGWERMSINDAAQKVQVSGHPDRYGKRVDEAKKLLQKVGSVDFGDGEAPNTPDPGPELSVDKPQAGVAVPVFCPTTALGGGGVNSNGEKPTLVASLNPKGSGNWQGAANSGTNWFVAHAYNNDEAQIIHRLRNDGSEADQMWAVGADHATGFGIVGSTVYASWDNEVRTFQYRAGGKIRKAQTAGTGWRGMISIDPSRSKAVLRNGNKYQQIALPSGQPIGKQVVTETGPRQGFGMNGDSLYVLSGSSNSKTWVDSYSFTSGELTGTQDLKELVQGGGWYEAEGVYGNVIGIKRGTGADRRLELYRLATAEKANVTTKGTTGVRTVTSYGKTYKVPIPDGKAGVAINFALDQLGDRYVWGSHGPDAWDCSGLTAGAWKAAGVRIPPQSLLQRNSMKKVPISEMRPGDVLWHPGHVQLYLGVINGKRTVVEAPNPRKKVRIDQTGWMNIDAVLRPNMGVSA